MKHYISLFQIYHSPSVYCTKFNIAVISTVLSFTMSLLHPLYFGFTDSCLQSQLKNELFLYPFTDVYEDTYNILYGLYRDIKKKYPTQKKGFFFCNDTYANIFLNILFINHESIPDEYELIGFDNSPNSPQAIIPITTIGQNITALAQNAIESIAQQIDSINSCSSVQTAINHIIIPPTLIERQTTSL